MATTTNYGLTKPAVSGDVDAWGGLLNADLDAIDAQMKATADVAAAAVPAAGGVAMTGVLPVKTTTMAHSALGSTNTPLFNFSNANSFSFTPSAGYAPTVSFAPSTGVLIPLLVEITNGGAFAGTWSSTFHFPGASVPALTSSGVDILAFVSRDGGTTFRFLGMSKNV